MKKRFNLSMAFYVIVASTLLLFTSCEKHDGIMYFNSKCIAELNGQTYYDQQTWTFSPDIIRSPSIDDNGKSVLFCTFLCKERGGGDASYIIDICLYTSLENCCNKEQAVGKIDFDYPDGDSSAWRYVQYCKDNEISYARVNDEIADKATFKITSYDKDKKQYNGTFTLSFSEGTLTGEFSI